MIRIRFHGRGGHGIKTASRILGTAAFLSGLQAQDSPVYGAERRGAALTAFTRIDAQPICERGPVANPDLVLVADETLFADPAAGVLVGCDSTSAVLVNSPQESGIFVSRYKILVPVLAVDLSEITTATVGRGSALSAALGAAACALVGLAPVDVVVGAVREELADLGLASEEIDKNIVAARHAYRLVQPVRLREQLSAAASAALHAPVFVPGPGGVPVIYAPGNSPLRHTGAWRVVRPVIDFSACTRCGICFALCPDGAIGLDPNAYPVIDYDNCKGCMICREECPIHCIGEEKEVRAW